MSTHREAKSIGPVYRTFHAANEQLREALNQHLKATTIGEEQLALQAIESLAFVLAGAARGVNDTIGVWKRIGEDA